MVSIRNRARGMRRSGESGQATIETAIVLTVLVLAIFWIFEVCMIMYTYTVIANAAHEGARYAMVQQTLVANDTRVTNVVKSFAATSLHDVSAITVTVSLPDGSNAPPNRVRVQVTYNYIPYFRSVMQTPAIHAYSETRMVVQ